MKYLVIIFIFFVFGCDTKPNFNQLAVSYKTGWQDRTTIIVGSDYKYTVYTKMYKSENIKLSKKEIDVFNQLIELICEGKLNSRKITNCADGGKSGIILKTPEHNFNIRYDQTCNNKVSSEEKILFNFIHKIVNNYWELVFLERYTERDSINERIFESEVLLMDKVHFNR